MLFRPACRDFLTCTVRLTRGEVQCTIATNPRELTVLCRVWFDILPYKLDILDEPTVHEIHEVDGTRSSILIRVKLDHLIRIPPAREEEVAFALPLLSSQISGIWGIVLHCPPAEDAGKLFRSTRRQ